MKGVRAMITTLLRVLVVVGLLVCGVSGQTGAEERSATDQEKRIEELAKNIEALSKQLQALKEERSADKAAAAARDANRSPELTTQVDKMSSSKVFDSSLLGE